MEVTEPHGSRFELIIEQFCDGQPFSYQGTGFLLAPDGALELRVPTSWQCANVTEQTALDDFSRAMESVESLVSASVAFASSVVDRARRYVLVEDYGMGGIELCHLVNGRIIWKRTLPNVNAT
jgi:hypothetical protein